MLRESSSDAASVLEINSGNMFVDDDTSPMGLCAAPNRRSYISWQPPTERMAFVLYHSPIATGGDVKKAFGRDNMFVLGVALI